MIVRDEAAAIGRCLASCRALIDHWVICDTGSTDDTTERCRQALAGIPGSLHDSTWVDFGHNRTELLGLARGTADYLLLLDADMTLSPIGSLPALTADAYRLRLLDGLVSGRRTLLVRGDLIWRYAGAARAQITSVDGERTVRRLDALTVAHRRDGARAIQRLVRDQTLVEQEVRRRPDSARAVFDLAQIHREMFGLHGGVAARAEALAWYRRRARMGGDTEEQYHCLHQVGVLSATAGDWITAADAFVAAWEVRPDRYEAVHDLAAGLLARGRCRSAHRFTSLAASPAGLQVPDDERCVSPWVYEWGLLFQHVIATYRCDEHAASIAACHRLLRVGTLPDRHRLQTRRNLSYALRELSRGGESETRRAAADPPQAPRIWAHSGRPTRGRAG